MAASQAIYLKGSTLWRKHPTTGIYAAIPQMRIVPVPTATQVYEDSTNHDSDGAFEENVPTIKRGDDLGLTFVYHYDIALHVQLYQDFILQTVLRWHTLFPDGVHGWGFEGRVSKFGFAGGGLEYTGLAVVDGGLKITGLPEAIILGS